jgi:hypothetical protein
MRANPVIVGVNASAFVTIKKDSASALNTAVKWILVVALEECL